MPSVGRPGVRRIVVVAVVAAVLLGGAGLVAYVLSGDVPRGTRVLGLDLGAKSRSEAERALADAYGPRATEPVDVNFDGARLRIAPADIGMTLDIDATVARAMRGPARLSGHRIVSPVIRLDQAKLDAVLRRRVDPSAITLIRPSITFDGLTPRPTYGSAGTNLDPEAAAVAVRRTWLTGGVAAVGLTPRPPVSSRADVDRLVAELAEPAVAAPVTVRAGDKTLTLAPAAIAHGLVFRADAYGELTPSIDTARLRAAARRQFTAVETPPGTAGAPGSMIDMARLGPDLLTVLGRPAPRTVRAHLVAWREGAGNA
ncbi:hypothetical protein GCM10012284_44390 [Mangrovihabitans endophyticus]|uniref:Peptidoglycan binding domain-containing protein n=1 Tax=Mangrovihabitans endophyticus TaxID=1751298 RepID=A0A8J3C1I4_9ACTN|nr:hypothetical protein GCM10012284_44390 [Mangrovihabitans endophyticus]